MILEDIVKDFNYYLDGEYWLCEEFGLVFLKNEKSKSLTAEIRVHNVCNYQNLLTFKNAIWENGYNVFIPENCRWIGEMEFKNAINCVYENAVKTNKAVINYGQELTSFFKDKAKVKIS